MRKVTLPKFNDLVSTTSEVIKKSLEKTKITVQIACEKDISRLVELLNEYPHIVKLDLSQGNIRGKGLLVLCKLNYVKKLNLSRNPIFCIF